MKIRLAMLISVLACGAALAQQTDQQQTPAPSAGSSLPPQQQGQASPARPPQQLPLAQTAQIMRDVSSLTDQWQNAFNSGDAKAASSFYASNGFMINAHEGMISGEKIGEFAQQLSKAGTKFSLNVSRVDAIGNDAILAAGPYTAKVGANESHGNWLRTLRHEGNDWKIAAESFTPQIAIHQSVASGTSAQGGQAQGDPAKIDSALSAAPQAVAQNATVVERDPQSGQLRMLKQGSNGWTCMPDDPRTPGNDPKCMDKTALAWTQSHTAQQQPQAHKVGIIYMLAGASDASDTDQQAISPTAQQQWVSSGPVILIVGGDAPSQMDDLPQNAAQPDAPHQMWNASAYQYVMIPAK